MLNIKVRSIPPNREHDLPAGIRKQICAGARRNRLFVQRHYHIAGAKAIRAARGHCQDHRLRAEREHNVGAVCQIRAAHSTRMKLRDAECASKPAWRNRLRSGWQCKHAKQNSRKQRSRHDHRLSLLVMV
jgi:hypothetical protein